MRCNVRGSYVSIAACSMLLAILLDSAGTAYARDAVTINGRLNILRNAHHCLSNINHLCRANQHVAIAKLI